MTGEAAHIFVVDDDERLAELLCRYLNGQGYIAVAAQDAADARRKMASFAFDLVVLDIMMPGESGLVLAKELSGNPAAPPVLLITALDGPEDRVDGLSTGAEDYITKPFDPRELVLRIERVLRRQQAPVEEPEVTPPPRLMLGPYLLDVESGDLSRDGERLVLTSQEQRMLRFLAARVGEEVSRDDLAEMLEEGATPRAVDVQIARLRKKFEPDPRNPNWLQTVRGVGYRLTGRRL